MAGGWWPPRAAGSAHGGGGAPDNVTLSGESADGYSTRAHLVAPSPDGLFGRVILQGSPGTSGTGRRNREDALAEGTATVAPPEEHRYDFRKAPS